MKNIDIVTGTGRSGTTLLIQILRDLGLTSTNNLSYYVKHRAGLECIIEPNSKFEYLPKIIKDPRLLTTSREILKKNKDKLSIGLAMLCVREFDQSAKSRVISRLDFYRSVELKESFGKTEYDKHIIFFQRAVGFFIETCSMYDIPLVILNYPRFAQDKDYLFRKLTECCGYEIDYERFCDVFEKIVVDKFIRTIE